MASPNPSPKQLSINDADYSTRGLPSAPSISMTTIPMCGLLVDTYGLSEAQPSSPLTCLWLLHPRTRTRAHMADIARRTIHAYLQHEASRTRSLVALAFDLPNHGTRLVSETANHTWAQGNKTHAIDMAGMIAGAKASLSALMDLVAGYLRREVDAHMCLGVSLGGHAAWWSLFGEHRMDAAVVVVGCPDYIGLMTDRAAQSGLDAASLLDSEAFPVDLQNMLAEHDPKALMFGHDAAVTPEWRNRRSLKGVLSASLEGKKVLVCSGAEDTLVPYEKSRDVLAVLKDAADGWWREEGGLVVQDKVYAGAGHEFSKEMVGDAVGFLVNAVADGPRLRGGLVQRHGK